MEKKKYTISGAIILLLYTAFLILPAAAESPEILLQSGIRAFEKNYFQSAVKSFTALVDDFPDYQKADQAAYLLALCHFYLKNYTTSLNILLNFTRDFPVSALNHRIQYWLGADYYNLTQYQKAIACFDQQISSPDNTYQVQSLYLKGLALQKTGSHEQASLAFQQLLAVDGGEFKDSRFTANVLYQLGSSEFTLGDYESALNYFKNLLLSFPGSNLSFDASFFIGECLFLLSRYTEAEKRYQYVLELFPDSGYRETCLYRLADIMYLAENYEQSWQYITQLETGFPRGTYHDSLARLKAPVFFKLNRFTEAIPAYTSLLETAPAEEKQALHYNLGLSCRNTARFREAADWFSQAAGGEDTRITENSLLKLAEVYIELGNTGGAITVLEKYKIQYPRSRGLEEVLRTLGLSYMKTGKTEAGLETWGRLLQDYPHSLYRDEYLFRRGLSFIALDNFKAALADLNKIIQLYPGSIFYTEAYYNIGYIYSMQNEYVRSLEYYEYIRKSGETGELLERTLLATAINHYNLGDFERSTAILKDLIYNDSNTHWKGTAHFYLGKTHLRAGNLPGASSSFSKAAAILENTVEGADALYWQGWTEFRQNNLAEARDIFLQVPVKYPEYRKSGECYFRAGLCESLLENWQQSNVYLNLALETLGREKPSQLHEDILYQKGMNFLDLNELKLAEASFTMLQSDFPGSELAADGFFRYADVFYSREEWQKALAGYELVVRTFPGSAHTSEAIYKSGRCLVLMGQFKAGTGRFLGYLIDNPGGAYVEQALAGIKDAFIHTGDHQMVTDFYDKCMASKKLSLELKNKIRFQYAGWLLPAQPGDAYLILESLQNMNLPEPLRSGTNLLTGDYFLQQGETERAYYIFKGISDSNTGSTGAEAGIRAGDSLARQGRKNEAFDEYLKISFIFPDFTDQVLAALEKAYALALELGREKDAERIRKQIREEFNGADVKSMN